MAAFSVTPISHNISHNAMRFGFFPVSVAAAVLIAHVVVTPTGTVARFLSTRPMVLLGRVSYGLYLFHYPIFQYEALRAIEAPPEQFLRLGVS